MSFSVRLGMPVLLRSRPTGVHGACLCHAFGFGVKKNAFIHLLPPLAACVLLPFLPLADKRQVDWWMLAFVVLGLVFSIPSQEIVFGKPLQNELFCVEWGVKPQLNYPADCKYNEYIYLLEWKSKTELLRLQMNLKNRTTDIGVLPILTSFSWYLMSMPV